MSQHSIGGCQVLGPSSQFISATLPQSPKLLTYLQSHNHKPVMLIHTSVPQPVMSLSPQPPPPLYLVNNANFPSLPPFLLNPKTKHNLLCVSIAPWVYGQYRQWLRVQTAIITLLPLTRTTLSKLQRLTFPQFPHL